VAMSNLERRLRRLERLIPEPEPEPERGDPRLAHAVRCVATAIGARDDTLTPSQAATILRAVETMSEAIKAGTADALLEEWEVRSFLAAGRREPGPHGDPRILLTRLRDDGTIDHRPRVADSRDQALDQIRGAGPGDYLFGPAGCYDTWVRVAADGQIRIIRHEPNFF
jgi:hypothetical protein